jgi:hypothetical protein
MAISRKKSVRLLPCSIKAIFEVVVQPAGLEARWWLTGWCNFLEQGFCSISASGKTLIVIPAQAGMTMARGHHTSMAVAEPAFLRSSNF